MKYFLIAGEASGDLHGARLMKAIRKNDPAAVFMYQGGDLMKAEGGSLLRHYRDSSFMLLEVVLHLGTILRNMKRMKKDILNFNPDLLILIDYPGFNLRMARFAHRKGFKVFYYISPKVWAWKKGRIKQIRKYVDKLFVIFPFEVEYFRQRGIEVEYHGNPLVDAVSDFQEIDEPLAGGDDRPLVALLAGSRKQEVRRCLPPMLEAAKAFPDYRFVIAGAPSLDDDFYNPLLKDSPVELMMNKTYSLLKAASASVVTSGTATLETALFSVPEVVVYRTGLLSYLAGSIVLKIPFISLVNIILQKEAVKELIQTRLTERIKAELEALLHDADYRDELLKNYELLHSLLGRPGAAERAGTRMVELLKGANK